MFDQSLGGGALLAPGPSPLDTMKPVRRGDLVNPNSPAPTGAVMPVRDLDKPKALGLHRSLLGHYLREMDRHSENRSDMELDERFYDNDPWSPAEKFILQQRGQMATNFNVISTTINWLIGTERRGRTDYKILPRRKDGGKAAERKTDLMKYLSDSNDSDFAFSQAFASAIKSGIGWMESGWQGEDDGEPVYDRNESWRSMLWDSFAQNYDLSDARYMFRTRWSDVDTATAMFPERREFLELAAMQQGIGFGAGLDEYGDFAMDQWEELDTISSASSASANSWSSPRERVRLMECWFRRPAMTRLLIGGDFSGEIFDPESIGHQNDIDTGRSALVEKSKMRMYVALMTTKGLLHVQESPYRHNRYPFTPVWAYRRAKDGMPYGMIRGLRDLQTHINKAASKAQYVLSTNKTIMDEGAVADLDEYAEEVARPDAIIVKKRGFDLAINVDRELAPAHLDLMSRMIQMVQSTSGVTDESLGRTTNAVSGKAITARQDQGSLASAEPFDNLRYARKTHGAKMLSLTEQFMTAKKEFRITNMRGTPEYVTINDGLPENDIARTKADFVISEQAWNATMRQAAVTELMEFIGKVAPGQPMLLMAVLDLIAESMDIPNRDEIVKRIRQISGQKDPDADPNAPPTPEEQAHMADAQAKQQMQARMDMAQVTKVEQDAKLSAAKVADLDSDATLKRLEALTVALQNALALMNVPAAAPVADSLLAHADAVSGSHQDPTGTVPPMPDGVPPLGKMPGMPASGAPPPGAAPPALPPPGAPAGVPLHAGAPMPPPPGPATVPAPSAMPA